MSTINSDKAWKTIGKDNPYYGVITEDRFKTENLNDDSKRAFFQTGEEYVDRVFNTIHKHFNPNFAPKHILDFGCGTGRLALAFAKKAIRVDAVDISMGMLAEAQENAKQAGVHNVNFHLSDDALSQIEAHTYDLVNTYIVLQHINVNRGYTYIERMIRMLNKDGIGVIQVIFSNKKSRTIKFASYFRYRIPFLNPIFNVLKSKKAGEPLMQMNSYNMNKLLDQMHSLGVENIWMEIEKHGDFWGATLTFEK